MSTSAIMDLLLKIISMEESPEGKGTVQVRVCVIFFSLSLFIALVLIGLRAIGPFHLGTQDEER
jgi:hypothetical protein